MKAATAAGDRCNWGWIHETLKSLRTVCLVYTQSTPNVPNLIEVSAWEVKRKYVSNGSPHPQFRAGPTTVVFPNLAYAECQKIPKDSYSMVRDT
jgi:hypothetical protein